MLLNNFKGLMPFQESFTFKNVAGEDYGMSDILFEYTNNNKNSHCCIGGLKYNYVPTTATNNYTDEQTLYSYCDIVQGSVNSHNQNGLIVFVGSGNSEVTADDYKLESALNLSVIGASCYHNKNVTTVTRTFLNNTEDEVTVKEMGLYLFRNGYNGNNTFNRKLVMIGRKVLEAPIVLQPNETYTFSYQFTMNNFAFTEE